MAAKPQPGHPTCYRKWYDMTYSHRRPLKKKDSGKKKNILPRPASAARPNVYKLWPDITRNRTRIHKIGLRATLKDSLH